MENISPTCRKLLVIRLKSLRKEIEQSGEVKITILETSFALALSDVCLALDLTDEQHDEVLGAEAAAYVAALLNTRVWPTEALQEQVAPAVPAILAAIPA